jgi:hypothetical protein
MLSKATASTERMRIDRIASENKLTHWLKAVVPLSVSSNDTATVCWDMENTDVAYPRLTRATADNAMVRCIWDPAAVTRGMPCALQIVNDRICNREDVAKIGKALAHRNMKLRATIAGVECCSTAIEGSVLADRFKRLAWRLESVGEDFRFETVQWRFSETEQRRSYHLTFTFGPHGTLLQLDGDTLE